MDHCQWWVFGKAAVLVLSVSMCFVSFCGGAAQSVFSYFSDRIITYAAIDLMCPWQVSSGSSYTAIKLLSLKRHFVNLLVQSYFLKSFKNGYQVFSLLVSIPNTL